MHLFTKDISAPERVVNIVESAKYLCNNYFATAALKGGARLSVTEL